MNFTFLVILSLLTLGFTYETLKISHKQLCLIILAILVLLVSYNIKEKFTSHDDDDNDNETSALIFDKTRIQAVEDLLTADLKKQVRNDRDIKSELLNLKLA